jgi:ankyrin repeat protein
MKKWIGVVIAVFIIGVLSNKFLIDNYTEAKQLADKGDYQAFYTLIKDDIDKGDEDAKEILIEYFLKAVDEEDIAEVKYYLSKDNNIINSSKDNGPRAMDLALIAEDKINIDFIKLLLTYKPELDYEILFNQETFQFSEKASIHCAAVKNGSEALRLLLKAGMDPNVLTNKQNGHSKYPPLYTGYRFNNFEVFEKLLEQTSDINPIVVTDKHEDTLIQLMMNEYIKVINQSGAKLEHPASALLHKTIGSSEYRQVHNKNMKYFRSMVDHGLIDKVSEKELRKIFVYLASTGEVDATKLFVSNGICSKYKGLCNLAMVAARHEKFDQVEHIIKSSN